MSNHNISRRDYFAGRALPECIRVAAGQTTEPEALLSELFAKAALYSFFAADAMLEASGEGLSPGVIAELEELHRRVLAQRAPEVTARMLASLIVRVRDEQQRQEESGRG